MSAILFFLVIANIPAQFLFQRLQPPKNFYQIEDEDDEPLPYVFDDMDVDINKTEKGLYLGSPCDFTCSPKLHHVFCDPITGHCECEKKFPVKLSAATGCGKPKKLGEQCFYRQSCMHNDQHSSCIQVHHNAICQCKTGYHTVSLQRPTKRIFCAEDLDLLTSDISALAGVITGIAVLSGLICFVLKLFTQARSPRPRHFANANLAPPILFCSDPGMMLPSGMGTETSTAARSSSRASSQRTCVSSYSARRASSAAAAPHRTGAARAAAAILLVSFPDREELRYEERRHLHDDDDDQDDQDDPDDQHTGSRRPSLASVHSSGSSVRSYSTRRFEREREQKEEREMQLRLIKLHSSMSSVINKPPTPSPQSTDELLPSVQRHVSNYGLFRSEVPLAIEEECASTSFQNNIGPGTSREYI